MTSVKQLVAVSVAAFVAHTACAEGSFFKDRREAAAQAKPTAAPAKVEAAPAPPVQAPPPEPAPAPAPAPTHEVEQASADISGQVSEVPSTDTLVVAGQRVTLVGVRGVSEMTQPLQRWIVSTGSSVTCHPAGSRYRCTTSNGSDVGQIVLQNGGGTATPDAPANYRGAEMQARMARRGIWRQR